MFGRQLNILLSNSFFLFGARATGKSTYLKQILPEGKDAFYIDLLKEDQFLRYANSSGVLDDVINKLHPNVSWVVIDEVQKLPKLLDEVHRQIFEKRFKFALTGSSARKLKRGKANMLAGRAFVYNLFPLTHREIGSVFDLNNALSWGTLPDAVKYSSNQERELFLQAYTSTYIKEEVAAEQLVRGILPFQKFLPIVGQTNGEIVNFSNISRDTGVDDMTVKNYFSILEDTLLGFFLEAHHHSVRKRQRLSPKFYLFDTGIARNLQGLTGQALSPSTFGYGKAFEHFVILEIVRLASYARKNWHFSYLRAGGDAEIDLIIERPGLPTALVEIKSSKTVSEKTVSSLESFRKDFNKCEAFILSQEPSPRRKGQIDIFPWQEGITALGL